jgi:hypothetical protein
LSSGKSRKRGGDPRAQHVALRHLSWLRVLHGNRNRGRALHGRVTVMEEVKRGRGKPFGTTQCVLGRGTALAGILVGVAAFGLSLIFQRPSIDTGVAPSSVVLVAVLVVVALSCGRDPFHPGRVLAALLALGFVIGPIVHAATGFYALPGGSRRERGNLESATWMMLAAAVLAMLAMRVALGDNWRKNLRSNGRPVSQSAFKAAFGVVGLGVAALSAYLILTGRSSVSLQGRGASYAVIAGEGRKAYLSLVAPIGLGGLLVMVAWAFERRSRVTLVLTTAGALAFGAVMALPGSRANLLYAVVPLLLMYAAYRGRLRGRWLVVLTVVLGVVLIYGSSLRNAETRSMLVRNPIHTLLRTGPRPHKIRNVFLIDIAHTEPLLGAMDAYPRTQPFLGGESVALGFTGPVGWKFARLIGIRPDPPAGVTLTAATYGHKPSTFGSGLTATLPGELYANAGVPGVLVGFAAFGALAGWVRRRAVHSRASGTIVLYAVGITTLFAIFADYTGQFYRGGAVLLGAGIALAAGGERRLGLWRVGLIGSAVVTGAAGILIVRRLAGAPPGYLLTSHLPTYVVLAGISVIVSHRASLIVRQSNSPRSGSRSKAERRGATPRRVNSPEDV